MKTYYFGVWTAGRPGHLLWERSGFSVRQQQPLPFRTSILDGGLLDPNETYWQSTPWQLAHINGWTVLGRWDRTGDSRPGSCSSFIAEGIHTAEEMLAIAKMYFPTILQRIEGSLTTQPNADTLHPQKETA